VNDNQSDMAPVWVNVRILLIALGGVLAGIGYGSGTRVYSYTMIAAGAVTTIGPAAWAVVVAIQAAAKKRADRAKAVMSGINLVVRGEALDTTGRPIVIATGGRPIEPLPVTEKSACDIVIAHAPTAPAAK
jgi:hypothetical protein